MSLDKFNQLEELVEKAVEFAEGFYNDSVKKRATESRAELQKITVLCKELRKQLLEDQKKMVPKKKGEGKKKAAPKKTTKRKSKKAKDHDEVDDHDSHDDVDDHDDVEQDVKADNFEDSNGSEIEESEEEKPKRKARKPRGKKKN